MLAVRDGIRDKLTAGAGLDDGIEVDGSAWGGAAVAQVKLHVGPWRHYGAENF